MTTPSTTFNVLLTAVFLAAPVVALSLLFVGRIAYRAFQLYLATELATAQPSEFVRSPLTLVIFGTLASYYVSYAVGLIRSTERFASPSSSDVIEQRKC